jgi:amino acid transporter
MSESQSVESFGYKQELKRSLSLVDLLIYGLVLISPSAPVAVFGIVYNASKGMVPLTYLIGLVAMLFTALSYMTMSRIYPISGSVYTYAARSLGPVAGYFAGWAILLDYLLLPALNYVACAIAIHATLPQVPGAVWVVGLLAFSTTVNYFGIEVTARINFILFWLQLAILVLFAGFAGVALLHHARGAHPSLLPLYNPALATPKLMFGALSLAVLSFLGFDAVSTLSEEARGGSSAIGRATILSLVVCAVLFMAQTWLASLFVLDRIGFTPGDATNNAFYDIGQMVGGTGLKFLLAIPCVMFGAVAGAMAGQGATARLLFSMARDGRLPRLLAHVHPVRKVPERAIFLVAAVTLVLGVALVDQFELLTSMVSFGALLGFLLLHASVVAHFFRTGRGEWLRHLVVPAVGFLIVGYVLWNAERNAILAGVGWLALGLVLLLVLRFRTRSAT